MRKVIYIILYTRKAGFIGRSVNPKVISLGYFTETCILVHVVFFSERFNLIK